MNRPLISTIRRMSERIPAIAGRMTALTGLAAIAVTVAATAPTAATAASKTTAVPSRATTIDYTCHPQHEGIYTCQWLRKSLVYDPLIGRDDTQFVTWASMKYGTVNREIIQIWLEWKRCLVGCHVNHSPSGLDLAGGTHTVSAHLSPRLCSAAYYRPIFQFKYFEPKPANTWIKKWSYGSWLSTADIKPCESGAVL